MKFKLKADIEIEATDIDAAFLFVEQHFKALREGTENKDQEFGLGSIHILPVT